jgi:hypothetical protein
MKRFLWLGFVLCVYLICTGCGETFRPIIIPNPPTFPNPAAAHTVVAINDNGTVVSGSAMAIDVSGDTDVSQANVGLAPVHAVQQTASQVLVVNHSVTGALADSITKLNFSSTTINSATTISLPANSAPNFVAVAPTDTLAYVTLPDYVPPSVGVVNTATNSVIWTIPVGPTPNALAVTPDKGRLYVVNQGNGTLSAFNTADRSARPITGTLTSAPIWLSPRSDSQAVYVLESDGTLAWLDTSSTAGPDILTVTSSPLIQVAGATTMTYDPNLIRLYIAGGQQMAIVDVSQSAPQPLATIPIPPIALGPPNSTVPANATAVAALPDGTRAYVTSYAAVTSQLNISAVSGDGTTATYAYTLTSGHDMTPGVSITVTGTDSSQVTGFDGTFIVSAVVSGTAACPGTCFQAPNSTVLAATPVSGSGTGNNIFPQVTVVWATSNTIKTTIGIPPFPDATIQGSQYYVEACANARFRFMMAAGGDSSRAYLSSCDGGNVNIIDTTSDNYIENLPAPASARAPIPPSSQNPPQNPVFLIAGP